ncbi:MAG TPA: permease-like cell division protein FtsX [Candidatus Paceibacterota bacterium]
MLVIKIKRIIKAGFFNFWRNSWVSLATVLIVVITLFMIGSLIFARAVLKFSLNSIQEKVDISVYFKNDAGEGDILGLREAVLKLPEVKDATYISSDEALAEFKERHKNNTLITQSLDELGENPLGASLNIRAKEISQYESIAKFLGDTDKSAGADSIIYKINYFQNKTVINRLSQILSSANKLGLTLSVILIALSILVTFNTIRLAIYTAKEEIGVMRLVGASNKFISGPFIIEGVMYGVIGTFVTMLIYYPLSLWLGPKSEIFFGGMNVFDYYTSNFPQIFFILLVIGVLLGVISSSIAVRRYLKV